MACEPEIKEFATTGTTTPLTDQQINDGFVECGTNRPTTSRLNWLFGWITCHIKAINPCTAEQADVEDIGDFARVTVCANGSPVSVQARPLIGDELTRIIAEAGDAGTFCGAPKYLIADEDGKLGTFSPGAAATATGAFEGAQPTIPKQTPGLILPDNFANPTNFYRYEDLRDDYAAGTINEATITNSLMAGGPDLSVTLSCPTRLRAETPLFLVLPELIQDGFKQRLRIGYRWRMDGGAWEYPTAGGGLIFGLPINAITLRSTWDHGARTYPAGQLEFQAFYVGEGSAANPASPDPVKLNANTYTFGSGFIPFPVTTLRPDL